MDEDLLPSKTREKAKLSPDGEYAWRIGDVEEAVDSAGEQGLACIGVQPQFQLPEGTCEPDWLSYNSSERRNGEPWGDYVERAAHEAMAGFRRLCAETDFAEEAVRFPLVKSRMMDKGFRPLEYLYFVLYFDTEAEAGRSGPEKTSIVARVGKKAAKQRYRTMLAELTAMVNQNDPAGLIGFGAPEDEYSCEVAYILARLPKCTSVEETCQLVAFILNQAFDSSVAVGEYMDLASPIWEWWRSHATGGPEEEDARP